MSDKGYERFNVGAHIGELPKTPENLDELWETLKPVVRELQEPDGENKVKNEIAKAKELGFIPGAKVKLSHDPEVGEVVEYNEKSGGFYSGSRYPVVIKFKRGTFEYSLEQLVLVKD